jgi:hypothetical protein
MTQYSGISKGLKRPASLWVEDEAVPLGGVVAVVLAKSRINMHATTTSCTPQVIWSPPIRFPLQQKFGHRRVAEGALGRRSDPTGYPPGDAMGGNGIRRLSWS